MALLDIFKKQEEVKAAILPILPEEIYEAGMLDLQDVIAPHALKVSSRELDLGEKIARTFFVISYPRFLTTGWFAPIINIDKVLDISIFIHPTDTNEMLRKFQRKVAEVQSQISSREQKGMVRDPMLDTAYVDLEHLRDSLQQAQERLFEVGLYLTIYGNSREEIDKTESEVRSILESRLVYIRPALFQQEQGFRSVLPFANDELNVHTKLNSAPLSSIFPFISFDLTSDRGILYGINRHNSLLVLFDRFSLENYNSVTFAKSGAGKSYGTKLEILRSLMFDVEVIVIDPEREYEYLAETVGGRYFNISLSSEHHINPFDLAVPREDENPADVLRSNIIALVGLFRIMLGGLTPEEDAITDKAITETYALKDTTAEANFAQIEPPLLSDFELVLSGMEGSDSLVQRLSKYTKGTWSGFMNRPTNVAMYIITHHIWNTVRKELRKRLLVIDEAWWMMRSADTASFLFSIAKRGRKYFLGISTITQDVSDFLSSPYGIPMITNSSIQMLLRQSPTSVDLVQSTFKLSDEEKYLLLESDVGEGIFFAGPKHVALKVIASYTEDQIITSDPSQILAIKKAKQELEKSSDVPAPVRPVSPHPPGTDTAPVSTVPSSNALREV